MGQMTRSQIVAGLMKLGYKRDISTMYADSFLEYREASRNIQKNGAIVAHPRTGNPIENPYLKIRDKARDALQKMRVTKAEFLWADGK